MVAQQHIDVHEVPAPNEGAAAEAPSAPTPAGPRPWCTHHGDGEAHSCEEFL